MSDTAEKEEFSPRENMNITGLAQEIWKSRFYMLYATLLTAVFLLILFLISFIAIPAEQTFQNAVNFTFFNNNVDKNAKEEENVLLYPNGLRFSLNDLTSPLVIEKVYQDNKLFEKGIKKRDFIASIRVSPYAPTYKAIVNRYRARLKDRKLTFEERKAIEDNMARELRNKSQNNGLIQLYYASRLGIDPSLGKKLVLDIPKAWSDISIKQRGVLKIGLETGSKPLIDKDIFNRYDYPVILDIINQSTFVFRKHLQDFVNLDGAKSIIEPETGHTVNTLEQAFNKVVFYEIPVITSLLDNSAVYKNIVLSKRYIEERIFEETKKQQAILDRMHIISNILNMNKQVTGQKILRGNSQISSGKGEVVPQITEGFFNQMIEMIKKNSNIKLHKQLVMEQLKLQNKLKPVKSSLTTLKRRLNMINNYADSKEGDNVQVKKISDRINLLSNDLNRYKVILNKLFHQISIKRYSYDSYLYRNLAIEKTVINYHPAKSAKNFILSFTALILAAIIGLFTGLVRQRSQSNKYN